MMAMKYAAFLVVATLMASCAANRPYHVMKTPFNVSEHAKYTKQGTATVKGQAFLKRNDGQVVTCAGSDVRLLADTPFQMEVITAIQHGEQMNPADVESIKAKLKAKGLTGTVQRKATCDAQGNFTFNSLPAADWLVGTDVTWFVGTTQGGGLLKHITTATGKTTEVILTDKDRI